jgi:hypothetical protein
VEVELIVPKTKTSQTVADYPQLIHRSRFRIIASEPIYAGWSE